MKFPVINKRQKTVFIFLLVFFWLLVPILFVVMVEAQPLNKQALLNGDVEPFVAVIVLGGVVFLFTLFIVFFEFTSVHIDENGIILKCGILMLNRFSWNEVQRVEVFEVINGRTVAYVDKLISVLITDKPSWSFRHNMQIENFNRNRITFFFDKQALKLIKQYCKADVYRSKCV